MSTTVIRFAPEAWPLTDLLGICLMGLSIVLLITVAVMASRKL